MLSNKQDVTKSLHIAELLYLFLVALSFYMLFMSRSGEVYTVWWVLHPAFIPVFFVTTFLLCLTIFSSEKVEYKLLLIIIHSILCHFLFVIIFPVGDVGGQQFVLGVTRIKFENVVPLPGFVGQAKDGILLQVFRMCRGENFQAAITIILARMFHIDLFWVHLLFVPLLWSISVPLATFMITKILSKNESLSILSSLLVSAFSTTIYWGTMSVPISLGYIFFFWSIYFLYKYLLSDKPKTLLLAVLFFLASFLTHYLTGIMSFSLLLLALALKKHKQRKNKSPLTTKLLLLIPFIFCTSLLPLALLYEKFFFPDYVYFSLDKLHGLSMTEAFSLFILGECVNFSPGYAFTYIIGPLIGILGIIYYSMYYIKKKPNDIHRIHAHFLLLGFLMVLINYRILKLFMVGIPFQEERLWLLRDLIAISPATIVIGSIIKFVHRKTSDALNKIQLSSLAIALRHINIRSMISFIILSSWIVASTFIPASISAWITGSLYYAYPHYGPLQTTSYELDAVKYIDMNTNETYVVICDQWITFAAMTIVGTYNPTALYFSPRDPHGTFLFIEMKGNPTSNPMIEAMKINNATTSYFIIEKPRLGTEEYDRIKSQAQQNGLETYQVFYYREKEKLCIFYYKSNTST